MGNHVRYITCSLESLKLCIGFIAGPFSPFPCHNKKVRRISSRFEKGNEGCGMHKSGQNGKGGQKSYRSISKVQPET